METNPNTQTIADLLRTGRAYWRPFPTPRGGNARQEQGQLVIDGRGFATRLKDGVPVLTEGMREFSGVIS